MSSSRPRRFGRSSRSHRGGRRLQERPLGGVLLTVDGDGHTIAATDANPCVNDAVAGYLVEHRLPAEGAR